MMGIDMTKRKLKIPPKFIPYLEKHRIFELFYELTQFLVQEKPKDHLTYMRDKLPCAAASRNKPKIVFMAPPSFDRFGFADQLVEELGIEPITRQAFMAPSEESEIELPCCAEEEGEGKEEEEGEESGEGREEERGEDGQSRKSQDFKKPYQEWLGEDQSLDLPSPPSGSVSGYECEAKPSSKKSSKSQESDKPEKGADKKEEKKDKENEMEKYYGIRVCPCKRKETEASIITEKESGEKEKSVGEGEKEKESEAEAEEEREMEKEGEGEAEADAEGEGAGSGSGSGSGYGFGSKAARAGAEKEIVGKKSEAEKIPDRSEKGSEQMEIQKKQKKEKKVLNIFGCRQKGWILVDFPSNAQEAETLSKMGVIPTHALRIITNDWEWEQNREYKCLARSWSKAYQGIPVTEIVIGQRSKDALIGDLTKMLQIMPHRHPPMLPRIALIGSRGSGTTTQAAKLVEKYGLVHVDFETITAQALQRDDDDDELSRRYKQQLTTEVDPEIEAAMLERAFLKPHCLKRGWVLTGYPKNLDQMRMLDLIAMPPNRIIFIEVPPKECFIRLYYRRYDQCAGTEYKIPNILPAGLDDYTVHGIDSNISQNLQPHPKNDKKRIINDIENYFAEKQQMIEYCGKTASSIDGNKPIDTVFELIDQILINSAPAQPPRKPLAASTDIFKAFIRLEELRKEAAAVSSESIA